MNKFLKGINAIIGFAGSSESPEKFSLRLMGIVTAFISQFLPFIFPLLVLVGVRLPDGVDAKVVADSLTPILQVAFLSVGCVMWLVGAARAFWKEYSLGAKLGAYMNR